MSELMDSAVINMPYEMAMQDEISRMQFYGRAQAILKELTELRVYKEAAEKQEQVDWPKINELVISFIDDYHYAGDGGYYCPTEWEKALITDCICGLIDELPLKPATRPAPCEHRCEAQAFNIDIRQLKAQLEKASKPAVAVPDDFDQYISERLTSLSILRQVGHTKASELINQLRCIWDDSRAALAADPSHSQQSRIAEQDAYAIAESFQFWSDYHFIDDMFIKWLDEEGRELLAKLNAQKTDSSIVSDAEKWKWLMGSQDRYCICCEETGYRLSKAEAELVIRNELANDDRCPSHESEQGEGE